MSSAVLDIIETDGRVYNCIIDYISKRQMIVYDLTGCNDPLVRLMAIKWKVNFPNLRFSIFKSIYYPNIEMPQPVVLSLKSIKYSNRCLKQTKPKRTSVKIPTTESPLD
ncbi:hypothetical protein [Alishewanella phage vB_AspM_Slickus01]|nr:hypothetical protein [Alishewanella phage vB_AspM_Slicko01]WGH49823.1 hypothetical protein [Alishewanella phage vB_AspM_Slickus01]